MIWRDYQADAAKLFRQLGCNAKVDTIIQGARAQQYGAGQVRVCVRALN